MERSCQALSQQTFRAPVHPLSNQKQTGEDFPPGGRERDTQHEVLSGLASVSRQRCFSSKPSFFLLGDRLLRPILIVRISLSFLNTSPQVRQRVERITSIVIIGATSPTLPFPLLLFLIKIPTNSSFPQHAPQARLHISCPPR